MYLFKFIILYKIVPKSRIRKVESYPLSVYINKEYIFFNFYGFTQDFMNGKLYLVSTPIGNLEDITLRALNVLKTVDLIAAEDTRHTRQLLTHYDIHAKLESCHAFNEHGKTQEVLNRVLAGAKVGLVTDAGTPCVADPGFLLVREAVKAGIEPKIIPGVSALTFAIAASGLPSDRFAFYGFLPVKSGRRSARIAEMKNEGKSVVIFESPYRVAKLLKELCEQLGGEVLCAVIREATKIHEEVLRGTLAELSALAEKRTRKGECVVVVHPVNDEHELDDMI